MGLFTHAMEENTPETTVPPPISEVNKPNWFVVKLCVSLYTTVLDCIISNCIFTEVLDNGDPDKSLATA